MTSTDGPIKVSDDDIPSDGFFEKVETIPKAYRPYNLLPVALGSDRRFLTVFGLALLVVFLWALSLPRMTQFQLICFTLVFYLFLYRVFIFRRQCRFKKKVCKALAGLELGKVHCSDDLAVYGLSAMASEHIVDGVYDCLLSDPLTCKYIGFEKH